MPSPKQERLLTLDALRGVAAVAVAVVLYHVPVVQLAPRGYLAVDFFFLLSGFVIARTYDARLTGGLSFRGFVAARLIRLYPFYLLGLGIGVAKLGAQVAMGRPALLSTADVPLAALANLAMLPFPGGSSITPFNDPSWSLVFEMAINLVYAAAMVRARLVTLAVVVAVSAGLLAYKASSYGSLDFGYAWDTLGFGFARVAFGFTLGVLMARVDRRRIRQGIAPLALAIVLAAALCMPVEGLRRTGFDLGFAFLAAPAIVWFGAAINPLPALTFTSRWLGELSYPVYALHYPLLGAAVFVAQRYGWPTGIWVVLFVAALLVVCLALSRGIEHPIRSRLNARLAAALGRSRKTMVQPSRR